MAYTAQGLVAHARAQLGLPYIYAYYGNKLTTDYNAWSQRTYHSVWASNGRLNERAKRAAGQVGKYPRAYDCAGLVKSYWMQETPTTAAKYVAAKDKSAQGLYESCKVRGTVKELPKGEAGILVFIYDAKNRRMRHVGISDGAGRVIEAQGFKHRSYRKGAVCGFLDTLGAAGLAGKGKGPNTR